jgi:hypothetical protein
MDERSDEKDCAHDEKDHTNLQQTAGLGELTEGSREIIWMCSKTCWNTQSAATEYDHCENTYPTSEAHEASGRYLTRIRRKFVIGSEHLRFI